MLTGTSPFISVNAPSPSAFVYAYASGHPSDDARERPAAMSLSDTHRCRSCSVFDASAGVPAAPSSARASCRKRASRVGVTTLGVGVGPRSARGGHFASPVDAEVERSLAHELLGRVAATVARDVAGRHRDEMRGDAEIAERLDDAHRTEQVDLDGIVDRGVERDGRGGVDEDLARRELRRGPPSSRPSPSVLTSPAITVTRRAIVSSKLSPSSSRRWSKASLRRISRCTRCAADVRRPLRTSRTREQSGTARSSRSTTAVPRNPVEPVTAMRRPASASRIIGPFLPFGRGRCLPNGRQDSRACRTLPNVATRDRVLDVALGSFGTRGYEASSLDAIAAELGVRKQTILYYFPSKEALLEAVIDRQRRRALDRARGRARPSR